MAKTVKRKQNNSIARKSATKSTQTKKQAGKNMVSVKKAAAKKTSKPSQKPNQPGTDKKVISKKTAPKKAAKSASKNTVSKKASSKKVGSTKEAEKKFTEKKSPAKQIVNKKSALPKLASNGGSSEEPSLSKNKITNQETAVTNSQAALLNDNEFPEGGGKGGNEPSSPKPVYNESITTSANVPVPAEKYARPADPYHGNISPTKGKVNVKPSGKKPLWNK